MKFTKILFLSVLFISYSLDLISAADDSYKPSVIKIFDFQPEKGEGVFNLEELELNPEDYFLEGATSIFSEGDAKQRLAEPAEEYIDSLLTLNAANKFGSDSAIISNTLEELLAKLLFRYKLKFEARDGTFYTRKKCQEDLDKIVHRIEVLFRANSALTAPLNRKSQAAIEKIILEISEISSQD